MQDKIIFDIGSSTIKIYKFFDQKLTHLQNISVFFKDGFTKEQGISKENQDLLIDIFNKTKKDNQDLPIEIYATSIFRKMDEEVQKEFVSQILKSTGLNFNIISHDQESFYIQQALVGYYNSNLALIINIGGGSTELIVVKDKKAIEKHQLENLGVGSLITKYPQINKPLSKIKLSDLTKEIGQILPDIDQKIETAFYSGGELTYMELADYNLTKNNLFEDESHPKMILFKDFTKRNEGVFNKVTLQDLESLMPQNPKWMHGARACSAIAQVICKKYSITNIIPSNSNLVDGIVRQPSK